MPYVVVKKEDEHGSIALPMEHGEKMVKLIHALDVRGEHLMNFVVSNPEAYGEYAPYKIYHSKIAFLRAFIEMAGRKTRKVEK